MVMLGGSNKRPALQPEVYCTIVMICQRTTNLLTALHLSRFPSYLENQENQEKSGNLKIDQKFREFCKVD